VSTFDTYITVFFGALTTVALFAYGDRVSEIIKSIGSASTDVGGAFLGGATRSPRGITV